MHNHILATLAFAAVSSAHFSLLWPPVSGSVDEEQQTEEPCGGASTELSDSSADLTVEQFAISVRSSHPEGHWAFNIANSTSEPFDWVTLSEVQTQGVGEFCLPSLSIPAEYVGSSGVLQIVDTAADGMLYAVSLHFTRVGMD